MKTSISRMSNYFTPRVKIFDKQSNVYWQIPSIDNSIEKQR